MRPLVLETLRDQFIKPVRRFQSPKTPRRWIGLDFGSSSIKLVELEQTATGIHLVNRLIQELPSAHESQPVDRVGWLQAALKEFGAREVHLAVGGPEVALRRVRVPPMSKAELAEAVKWQVKDELPFPIQEAVLDFEVVGEVWDKDIKKLDVLVAAVPKGLVQGAITLVEQAGSRVASVSPAPLVLWQTVKEWSPAQAMGSVALVDMGAHQTHLAIVHDGHLRVARELPIGSAHLTQAMVGVAVSEGAEMTLDLAKAEQIKRQYGILAESVEGTTEEGISLTQLTALMRSVLENLLTEFSRFLDFYKVQLEEAGVARILLCGGGANLKHLQTFLSEGLAIPILLHDPLLHLQRTSPTLSDGGPRLAVALGAALAHGRGMNLLPPELVRLRTTTKTTQLVKSAASGIGALAVGGYLVLQLVAWQTGWRVQSKQQEWAKVEPAYTHYMTLAQEIRRQEGKLAAVQSFLDGQPAWDGIFKELGHLAPASIELTQLTATRAEPPAADTIRLRLQGTAALSGAGAEGSLTQFLDALEQSVFFRNVHLESSQVQTGSAGMTTFEIHCELE